MFVLVEARLATAPMLPLHLLRSRPVAVGCVLMAMVGASSVAMWYFISLYLQRPAPRR